MVLKKGIMKRNIQLKSEGKELLRERRQGSANSQHLAICNGLVKVPLLRREKEEIEIDRERERESATPSPLNPLLSLWRL